jgi:hypothetical protein
MTKGDKVLLVAIILVACLTIALWAIGKGI